MDVKEISLVECPPYRMQLTSERCAGNWESVAGQPLHKLERLHHCSGCRLGAERAGKAMVPTPLPRFCCRCMKLSTRLIGRRLCPSCYNRERELRLGINARGTQPVKITPVAPISVKVLTKQELRQVDLLASSRREVALWVLRNDISAVVVRNV